VGTRFRILFPVSEKPVEALPERSAVDLSGHGVVLVVDDDEFVLRAASIVLESFGYSVILAGDGSTCVARFRERPSEIDLVVLDLNMQGMSGEETLEALRAIRPDVRVLLSTGFDENDAEQRLAGGFVGFLSKPYEPEELASAVRRILGTEQETPSDFDSEFAVLKAQYKRKLPDKLHELETAIRAAQARDAPESALHEACRQVHSLMGTSGSYGFEDAAAALQILDAALREILERSFTGEEAWARVEDALTRVREIGSQLDRSASQ
jgi:CheY-like chemotaxis protein